MLDGVAKQQDELDRSIGRPVGGECCNVIIHESPQRAFEQATQLPRRERGESREPLVAPGQEARKQVFQCREIVIEALQQSAYTASDGVGFLDGIGDPTGRLSIVLARVVDDVGRGSAVGQ